MVMADLVKRGIEVMEPKYAGSAFDILAYDGSNFIKVQVKCSSPNERGKLMFDVRKSHGETRNYSSEDYDVLAVVDFDSGRIGYLEYGEFNSETGTTQVTMWTREPESMNGFGKKHKLKLLSEYSDFPSYAIGKRETAEVSAS
jgi:hypothetical protein